MNEAVAAILHETLHQETFAAFGWAGTEADAEAYGQSMLRQFLARVGGSMPVYRKAFSAEQIADLAKSARKAGAAERVCPACGWTKVRTYRYFSERMTGPTVISYVWCAHCHRFMGSTGPRPPTLQLDDPLTREEHLTLDHDLDALLTYLDRLWDTGVLPQ
jgi:hypothetical protein